MIYKNQSGRSMVEMLGTLAIIGVLSIGGIAGYSYGMDKYRANETINDVNLRGIDLVAQVSTGRTDLSLSEWPMVSKAGYTVSEPTLSTEGDAYFTISGVPKRVCEMVYEGIQNNQTTDVEINGYVVDDSSTCGDDNTMGFFFITNAGAGGTNPEDLCKNVSCIEGYICKSGVCLKNTGPEYISGEIVCKTNSDCGTDSCQICHERCYPVADGTICDEGQGECHQGSCVKNWCTNGCAHDEYCGDTNEDECSPHPYMCKKLNFSKIEISQGVVYLSNQNMSYWDAKSACEALGAKLIDQATMNKLYSEIKSKIFGVQEAWWLSETQDCQAYCGATSFYLRSKNSNNYVSALCFDDSGK